MTTFRAEVVGDRVMVIHDGPAETRWSEMPVDAAELLVRQMQIAIRQARETAGGRGDGLRLAVGGGLRAPIS